MLKLLAVSFDELLWILRDYLHRPDVTLTQRMLLEAVLIARLFLAHLTPPPQPLEPFLYYIS